MSLPLPSIALLCNKIFQTFKGNTSKFLLFPSITTKCFLRHIANLTMEDEPIFDDDLLAGEMERINVDSFASMLSSFPSNPSELARSGVASLKQSLNEYIKSGSSENNHHAQLT